MPNKVYVFLLKTPFQILWFWEISIYKQQKIANEIHQICSVQTDN